jgi:serine/threonine protein kinase
MTRYISLMSSTRFLAPLRLSVGTVSQGCHGMSSSSLRTFCPITSARSSRSELLECFRSFPRADQSFRWLSPAALDLAEWLLAYDPQVRASATQALSAPYFTTEQPGPELPLEYVHDLWLLLRTQYSCDRRLSELQGEWHELETKRERAKKRRKTEGGGAVSGHQ